MHIRLLVRGALTGLVLGANLLVLHAGAFAQSVMSERDFARFAARASQAEIHEAQIALAKTKNDNVMRYAKMMIDDHTASIADLGKIAVAANVPLPKILSPEEAREATQLQSLAGAAFDKQYMTDQVSSHFKAVAFTEAEVQSGSNATLKTFAAQYLAAEQRHLRMAQAIVSQPDRYLK